MIKTKRDIVKQVSEQANLPQALATDVVQWTFDAVIESLIEGGRLELRNFGIFEVKKRKPRKARNPNTGVEVDVVEKNVVVFKPGKEMKERIQAF